ncbi:DUF4118 domain-containing protein [Mesorhizobium sp. SP-1A]|uniref:DUF4118 domain-containing protein n=1 Tax=Mesorhizobium sp. SP-1A TaxID=3077840 RepID=UPI0028F72FF4|nr:DUF4118 domain-containing protein [Mesorhizobium sp. SP-1A]
MSVQRTSLGENPASLPAIRLYEIPFVARYLATLMMVAFAAVVAVGIDSKIAIPNLSLVFVVPVVVAAVVFGLWPSLFAAILGALAYNFFLTEPRYTLRVDDPANIWAIALLFVVGCIASAVGSTARRRTDDAERLKRQVGALQLFGRDMVADQAVEAAILNAANTLHALFRVPVVVMAMADAKVDVVEKRGNMDLADLEIEAARSALASGKFVPARLYPFDSSRFDFWPVPGPAGRRVVIGVAFDPDDRPLLAGNLVEIVANSLALALARR